MSRFEPADRRRILAAGITTLALAPLLLGQRGPTSGDGKLAAIGQGDLAGAIAGADTTGTDGAAAPVAPASADEGGGPGYLIGPPPATEPTVVRIAVPATSTGNAIQSTATFRRWDPNLVWQDSPCAVQGIVQGTLVTVISLQNGQSVQCRTVGEPRPGDRAPVVLDAGLFAQLADLIEQPINVRVTW